ncbi:MAG: T9SS type A sorting domain-containing protein [Chitinophagaceae bacterium]
MPLHTNIKHIVCLVCVCLFSFFSKAQLINSGAAVVVTAGTQLVIHNLSLQNNGVFNQAAGTINFTGNNNATISGSNAPVFFTINLDKPGAGLQLQTDITVNNQVQFIDGLIDLNTHHLILDPAALLIGETESSHASGAAGGYVQITKTLNAPVADDPGNIGAIITSSQNLGSVIIRRGHQSQTNGLGAGNSILRYYDIIPANNNSLNATLHFNYLDAELNGLNENGLMVWKSNDNINWTNLGRTSSNTISNYVEQTGINDFSRFTLSTTGNALPLIWSSFNTQCLADKIRISWNTAQEQNTSLFIILRSTNARNWTAIGSIPATGNNNSSATYSFTDQQPLTGTSYYQVQEKDIDGRLIISPVLFTNCGMGESVKIYPNPVDQNCQVSIQSATGTIIVMRLYDSKGMLVQQRKKILQNGNNQFEWPMDRFAKGIYSLVISWEDGKTKTVKVEKQ